MPAAQRSLAQIHLFVAAMHVPHAWHTVTIDILHSGYSTLRHRSAQQQHKRHYDAQHATAVIAVDDQVLSSTYTSGLNLKIAGTNKLAPRYVGVIIVIERSGEVAYRLDLPETLRIYTAETVPFCLQSAVTTCC